MELDRVLALFEEKMKDQLIKINVYALLDTKKYNDHRDKYYAFFFMHF